MVRSNDPLNTAEAPFRRLRSQWMEVRTRRNRKTSGLDLEALVHVRRDVADRVRFHHLELKLEQPRRILVLVRPFEPDRRREALPFGQVLERHAIDLRS